MSVMRSLLLAGSRSVWLRDRAPRYPFVRRAVTRFMPGEDLDDMLRAAASLRGQGLPAVYTRLGENVTELAEAGAVATHYHEAIDRIHAEGADCEPSIKLTQLGLDVDVERCTAHVVALAEQAHARGTYLWVDMEQSSYVDQTLAIVRRARARVADVGVCLQAYLRRTPDDMRAMTAEGIGVRLVKGAYAEPPEVAFPARGDVDAQYFEVAREMIAASAHGTGGRAVFGTHDTRLIARIREHAARSAAPASTYEFHMLYGIQREAQLSLTREGARVRVLIAYGSYWFPWYMRRLAERPANVWFVVKNLFG
jgi:proline dehydrogenase